MNDHDCEFPLPVPDDHEQGRPSSIRTCPVCGTRWICIHPRMDWWEQIIETPTIRSSTERGESA